MLYATHQGIQRNQHFNKPPQLKLSGLKAKTPSSLTNKTEANYSSNTIKNIWNT